MRCAVGLLMISMAALGAENAIRRLDGSRIAVADAEAFAAKTLTDARVTGAQIVVLNGGKSVWSAAFGMRRRDPALPMTRNTTMWAASITKSVFSVYVMQLVERGEFNLDTPVAKQLAKPLNEYDAWRAPAAALAMDPAWQRVTPRMLLAHTSGLGNIDSFIPGTLMKLQFEPGTRYRYSGDGINLVQFTIEQQKGRPLDQLVQDAIFTPLGMRRSGLIYRTEFAEDVADRYGAEEQFLSQTKRFPARGSGSMTTSAEDLAVFAQALFDGRLLRPATRRAMLKPFVRIRSQHQFPGDAGEPEGTEGVRVGLAYGMGWGLLTKTRFGPAFFKEGHGDGAQNYMICFERGKSCMILLTNSDNGEKAFRLLRERILGNTVTPWEWEGWVTGGR